MKFFTLAWYDTNNAADLSPHHAYGQHVAELRGVLPEAVWELTQLAGVDDGLVVHAAHHREREVLELTLRCGDLQVGYYDLALTYEGAQISPADEWALAQVARSTRPRGRHACDVAYHELDAVDGGIEHRWIFHPGIWFAIRCRNLRWEKIDRPDRDFPRSTDRFPGGPTAPPPGEYQDLAARRH